MYHSDAGDGWYYKDEASNEQGPFTSMQMASWAAGGHFLNTLEVRRGGSIEQSNLLNLPIYYSTIGTCVCVDKKTSQNILSKDVVVFWKFVVLKFKCNTVLIYTLLTYFDFIFLFFIFICCQVNCLHLIMVNLKPNIL